MAAYLARHGLEPEPPSADALARLHRAQVEHVPYETTWIHLGERWSIDANESVRRIAIDHRGGYCFHLNGAFGELLNHLGYHVTLHRGQVHGSSGPTADEFDNHLVLVVSDLPTDENPGGRWYVDSGLGDAIHAPLPLVDGTYRQEPHEYGLALADDGSWHFRHDPSGSFAGMIFLDAATPNLSAFEARHLELSTSPDSGFVRNLTVYRRDAAGFDHIRGVTLGRDPDGGRQVLQRRDDWYAALADVFGLVLRDVGTERREALWRRANETIQPE